MRTRFAFVHVPKSAGSSIKHAVASRCEPGTVAPRQLDRVLFGGFDRFTSMPSHTLDTIAVHGGGDLTGFDVAMGHFGINSFRRHFALDEIMTVLREPRSRLLSLRTFWGSWSAERHADWDPYDASRRAADSSWEAFLTAPALASQTDNLVARMLVSPHVKVPLDGFIDPDDYEEIFDIARAVLDDLGFCDVVESGAALWSGLSEWLDCPIEAERSLVTQVPPGTEWSSSITSLSERALSQRTSIDARLWQLAAARHADDVEALANATFHRKLASVAAATPPPLPVEHSQLTLSQRWAQRLRR
ncbi:MAG: hypothetical protein AB8G14_17920 [Ilumatobacter sp.]